MASNQDQYNEKNAELIAAFEELIKKAKSLVKLNDQNVGAAAGADSLDEIAVGNASQVKEALGITSSIIELLQGYGIGGSNPNLGDGWSVQNLPSFENDQYLLLGKWNNPAFRMFGQIYGARDPSYSTGERSASIQLFTSAGSSNNRSVSAQLQQMGYGGDVKAVKLKYGADYYLALGYEGESGSALSRYIRFIGFSNDPAFVTVSASDVSNIGDVNSYNYGSVNSFKWNNYVVRHNGNTTSDSNGFLKSSSPIFRLANKSEYADGEGFSRDGCGAYNGEAKGVTASHVSVGVYEVSGAAGFANEGWTVEIPQDLNGNRLCFVETETATDGTITVRTFDRRFDFDVGAVVAGEPMDIPNGRWIDLRLSMSET